MCHTTPLGDSSWLHPVLNRVSHLCLLPDGFIPYLTMCHTSVSPAGFIQFPATWPGDRQGDDQESRVCLPAAGWIGAGVSLPHHGPIGILLPLRTPQDILPSCVQVCRPGVDHRSVCNINKNKKLYLGLIYMKWYFTEKNHTPECIDDK